MDKDRLLSFLSFNRFIENDFSDISPVNVVNAGQAQLLLFKHLFKPDELISTIKAYGHPDQVRFYQDWMTRLSRDLISGSEAGCWFRVNPVKRDHGEHIQDKDVACHRHLLIEADEELSLEDQLSFIGTMLRSVASIVFSGSKSYHALVRINAVSEKDYRDQAKRILSFLEPIGVDRANGNPSRMSRLPNAYRRTDKDGTRVMEWQKLIYLNPDPKPEFIFNRNEAQPMPSS